MAFVKPTTARYDTFLIFLDKHVRAFNSPFQRNHKCAWYSKHYMPKIFHDIFLWHLSLHSRKSQNCSVFQIFICLKYSMSFSYGIYLSIPEKSQKCSVFQIFMCIKHSITLPPSEGTLHERSGPKMFYDIFFFRLIALLHHGHYWDINTHVLFPPKHLYDCFIFGPPSL